MNLIDQDYWAHLEKPQQAQALMAIVVLSTIDDVMQLH